MPYIICTWKQSGMYTRNDTTTGIVYSREKQAETANNKINGGFDYVVRKV